jgi:hypothetical protein
MEMSPELRAELDRIEDFLMGPHGAELANVLSALRGPDFPDVDHVKEETTIHIRRAAFPRLAAQLSSFRLGWALWTDRPFKMPRPGTGHFYAHVRTAAIALKLARYTENGEWV